MVDKNNKTECQDNLNISSQKMSLKETMSGIFESQDAESHCEFRAMWRSVITQALMDAGSNSNKPEFKKEKARAISWLSGDSDDFNEVCIMADLDPRYVKERAKEAIKRGCKWRKEKNPFGKVKKKTYATELDDSKSTSSNIIRSEGLVLKSLFAA